MGAFDTADFKKLKNRFYEKLKQQGFLDIENENGCLIDGGSVFDFSKRIGFKTDLVESVRDYYSWAGRMAERGHFESRTDEMIWRLHSEGKKSPEIADRVCLEDSWVRRKIIRIKAYLRTQDPSD